MIFLNIFFSMNKETIVSNKQPPTYCCLETCFLYLVQNGITQSSLLPDGSSNVMVALFFFTFISISDISPPPDLRLFSKYMVSISSLVVDLNPDTSRTLPTFVWSLLSVVSMCLKSCFFSTTIRRCPARVCDLFKTRSATEKIALHATELSKLGDYLVAAFKI